MATKDGYLPPALKLFDWPATKLLSLLSDNKLANQYSPSMKKLLFLSLVILVVLSCKKTKLEPKGPTDIRIKNISDQVFQEVVVNINGEKDTLYNITPNTYSDYSRFEVAYPKAEITAKINGVIFTTGSVNYTYLTYLGQVRASYVVWIKDFAGKKLEINDVIYEEPLVLK